MSVERAAPAASERVPPASDEWIAPAHAAARAGALGVIGRFFRSSPVGGACALLLLLLVGAAIFADRLAPYNPLTANYAVTRDPPFGQHVLGTDHLGRDVLSRILFGARRTLIVAISSALPPHSIRFLSPLPRPFLVRPA